MSHRQSRADERVHPTLRESSDKFASKKHTFLASNSVKMQRRWIRLFSLIVCLTLVGGIAEIGFDLVETHAANGHDRRRDQFPETGSRRY